MNILGATQWKMTVRRSSFTETGRKNTSTSVKAVDVGFKAIHAARSHEKVNATLDTREIRFILVLIHRISLKCFPNAV
jgi:hypothetical protein